VAVARGGPPRAHHPPVGHDAAGSAPVGVQRLDVARLAPGAVVDDRHAGGYDRDVAVAQAADRTLAVALDERARLRAVQLDTVESDGLDPLVHPLGILVHEHPDERHAARDHLAHAPRLLLARVPRTGPPEDHA